MLDADADVAGLLHQADGLVVAGRGRDALAILSGQASERAKRNEGVADGLAPRTRWGKTRAEEVRKLAHERSASVSAYRSALAADDANAVVATLEAQKHVESRAIAATAAAKDAPSAGCGPGDGTLRFFATLSRAMTHFSIRLATDADGAAVGAVLERVFAEYPGCLWEPREYPELETPATAFAAMGGCLWVVEDDGAVVGSGGYSSDERGVELRKLYLLPRARGHGLARMLVARVEDAARAQGSARVHLWSDTRFVTAHAVYEKLGYRRLAGTRPLHDVSDTVEYAFEKLLR